MRSRILAVVVFFSLVIPLASVFAFGSKEILTPEERLWLQSRNNTIVVYPEKNYPPFSYQSTSGIPQGLSIDYIELIAEKIGAQIKYLQAKPRTQIIDDLAHSKGDVIVDY